VKQKLKQLAIDMLGLGNAFPVPMTDIDQIKRLIQSLSPINAGYELIRLGPLGDGGYLVPKDLDGIEALFSPGVCQVSDFERDCAFLGMQVFMADKSVDGPAVQHDFFHFIKKYVGAIKNQDFITVDDWVSAAIPNSSSDLLLQMDIEGYEYEVFLALSDALMSRFRIIVVEFHDLDQLWGRPFFGLASRAFEKILQTHSCVHIHPNNACMPLKKSGLIIPPTMEFTFIRNDRILNPSLALAFPHPLDVDNANNPHFPLPGCWY